MPLGDFDSRLGNDFFESCHAVHVSSEVAVVVETERELDRGDERRSRHVTEGVVGHPRDVDHKRDAAARPNINRRATARDPCQRIPYRARQLDRVLGNAGA